MENNKSNKYEYLSHPCLINNFKQTYLSSLNIFLSDEKFAHKIESLPLLKSSSTVRFEKEIERKQQEKDKGKTNGQGQGSLKQINLPLTQQTNKQKQLKNNKIKSLTQRYIVMDHELIEITLSALEESNEYNSKLTDPFNSYFLESNEKIRRKALEQIISNIIPKKDRDKDKDKDKDNKDRDKAKKASSDNIHKGKENKGDLSSLLFQDIKTLEQKYKLTDEELKQKTASDNLLKAFNDNCNTHSIISLDQKIDYFVHLKKIGLINSTTNNTQSCQSKIIGNKSKLSLNNIAFEAKNDSQILKKATMHINNTTELLSMNKYTSELKSKFKINDDSLSMRQYEAFIKDIELKTKTFASLKGVLEKSNKYVDRIRLHLSSQEIQFDKTIIRQCGLTSDTLYYLLYQKYFDFNILRHLNLSRNPLGDIGGCYLFTLIESFGIKFDYLNVSYTKIGKQTNEILVNILKDNRVKIISLAIGGNALGDKLFSDLCIGISKNIFLTKLSINHNELGKISSVILGTILKYDKKIKMLDVSKNQFGDEDIGYMMKGLICNTSLETLMINDMQLTNKSLRVFETTLCINTTLRTLFLERNKFQAKGWRILSDILNKNKYIEFLSLVGNNFDVEQFDLISEQQRMVKIKVINKTEYLQMEAENDGFNLYEYIY